MIPKSQQKSQIEDSPIYEKNISFVNDINTNFDKSRCQSCNYIFGYAKNKIVYTQFVVLLINETEWKSICSKCMSIVDDRTIKFCYTYKEFQDKRISNEIN